MNKYFYIEKSALTKFLILNFIFFLFSAKIGFLFLLGVLLYLIMHKRKQIDFTMHRATGKDLIVAPVSGVVKSISEKEDSLEIEVKMSLRHDCGILMPFKGTVSNYLEFFSSHILLNKLGVKDVKATVGLESSLFPNVKIKIFGLSAFRKPEVFVRAGDRASTGGLIGYLPYGGKIVISVPKLAEILVKPGERVTSFQTLLAKYKG